MSRRNSGRLWARGYVTAYGKSQAAFFAQVAGGNGVAVISGLACGIRRAAHEGGTAWKGKTFAVLGCGVVLLSETDYPLMRRMHGKTEAVS